MIARHYIISGRVQGVGFRYFVVRHATALGLRGWVRNLRNGDVEAVAAGPAASLASFEEALRQGPMMSRVDEVVVNEASIPEGTRFEIA